MNSEKSTRPYSHMMTIFLYTAYLLSLLFLWLMPSAAAKYGIEDGPVENITAAAFLIASAAIAARGVGYLIAKKSVSQRSVLALLMAIALFVCAGEEISWGQRIFGIESGEFMQQYNWQGEVNLHNLQTDVANIAFHYGALLFLIIAPLFHKPLVQLTKKVPQLTPASRFIPPTWIAAPSFIILGMLDSRFVFMIEKPWAATFYLLALAAGVLLLVHQLFRALQARSMARAGLLIASLLLIGMGLFVSYIYAVDKQATNIISEYKELLIAVTLCVFALQWKAD